MLAGPSYSFKSFLALDWLCCMASGRRWLGRPTASCKVGYVLGEGKSSILKRVHAWAHYNQLNDTELATLGANFRVTFEVPQLASKASVDNMLADMEKETFKPEVIVIDTFARSMVGLDENDAKDTGMWIESADRLRQLGFGVIFLHHTKKNTEFGVTYRGSTAIIGAMDTAMTLVRDGHSCTLTVTKQKDHDEGPDMHFRRVLVPTPWGESCVLVNAPLIDNRFTEEAQLKQDVTDVVEKLLLDSSFESDTSRAKILMATTGLPEDAAKMRISRARAKVEKRVVTL